MSKLEEISTKISANKEVLETLPKNNFKNINIYLKKIDEIKEEFSEQEKEIFEELKKRAKKIDELTENKDISLLEEEVNNNEGVLYLLSDTETSFEKMDLDQAIQNLSHYYKKNLTEVNESIIFIIKKFQEVGITLKEEDFCYSKPSREYLSVVLFELKSEKINFKRIKSKFEEIYWKCPDIIAHIEANIRYIYLKNEKNIDKYYEKQKNSLIKKFTSEEIKNRYWDLKKQVIEKRTFDKATIINKFITGKLNTKDFSKANIQSIYEKFIPLEVLKNINENKLDEIDINLMKLLNSVYEYKNYLKFQYIVDNIKSIYKEKEKYKNVYIKTKKELTKKEQKVISLNNKIEGKGLFNKPNDKYTNEQNTIILEVKDLYKELEQNKIYNKIITELKDNSTIYDVLYFASCFYKYLFECIGAKNEEEEENEIDQNIEELKEFVKWPFITLLNNIEILDTRDILITIKDKYQLLDINITKEDLEENNLDSIIENMEKIKINHNMRKNGINIEEIENICELKKIVKI